MSGIRWGCVNTEPFEYAIQQGPHGDEFVKLLDGSCLRRPTNEPLIRELDELVGVIEAVRGERGILRVSGMRGDPQDVGVLGIERFNDLMRRARLALTSKEP